MGIQTNLKIRDVSRVPRLRSTSGNFYGSEIRHGIFWGLNFGPGIFWVLFKAHARDFLGFLFLPPFNHPCHLKSGVPAPPGLFTAPPNFSAKGGNSISFTMCNLGKQEKFSRYFGRNLKEILPCSPARPKACSKAMKKTTQK